MAMEVSLQHEIDTDDDMLYLTTIRPANKKPIILETLWHGIDYPNDSLVIDWISKIKKFQEKKKQKNLILSLFPDRKAQYKNSGFSYYDCKGQVSKAPFELLQLCFDNHCLFYEFEHYYPHKKYPLALWKCLSDNKTIVVGLGIEDAVKKLEKDYNIKISNWVDLRDKAREKATFGEIANNCSAEKLANKVLGDEWDVNKPATMEWWNPEVKWFLSDDNVKFGSLDSFLAYRIGVELLKD
ncbi:uncharacterized protein LOC107790151 [Nicotiana tabacum]|uniref:Uncharacterized protein LOC107790151 n=1 Tax=Nicotiana tabacum TaxID=4097 RepID=A0A1S3ZT78_TOBAC|nr:PREDICTED: Werner syndrome ATP-dependent helicase-like [Nicotiana tabacum]